MRIRNILLEININNNTRVLQHRQGYYIVQEWTMFGWSTIFEENVYSGARIFWDFDEAVAFAKIPYEEVLYTSADGYYKVSKFRDYEHKIHVLKWAWWIGWYFPSTCGIPDSLAEGLKIIKQLQKPRFTKVWP